MKKYLSGAVPEKPKRAKGEKSADSCPYNDGVGCMPKDRHCERCGWNPEALAARKAANKY